MAVNLENVTQQYHRSGILLLDKPPQITSHDVVSRVRRQANTRKVGHAGTLDPLATGLLILGLNSSTRLLTYFVGLDKEYEANIRLGYSTTTDDSMGEYGMKADAETLASISEVRVVEALQQFVGDIMQVPSSVSAIKVAGKRAYSRVRAGESVSLAARAVTVSRCELLDYAVTTDDDGSCCLEVKVRISCSSGTYIRAIARDLGENLGVGGHIIALRRTRIGPFMLERAGTLDHLDLERDLMTPAAAATTLFSPIYLDAEQAADLRNGKKISVVEQACSDFPHAALDSAGELIGLVAIHNNFGKVLVNFPTDQPTISDAESVTHD